MAEETSNPNPRFRPIIRVFVSSTFSDLKAERNELAARVFPKLEHYCLVRGFQFEAIDLRWGVPSEAGRDHRTMRMCFDELRRAQEVSPRPNFLVLLGDRYGWQPLAESATEEEFAELARAAVEIDTESGRNFSNPNSAYRILEDWYRRDENADPAEYMLRSRYDWPGRDAWSDEEAEKQAWEAVERTLWEIINRAWRSSSFDDRFAHIPTLGEPLPSMVKFQASATEQEIWRGALAVPDAEKHVVAWYRMIRNRGNFGDDARLKDFFDQDASLRKQATTLRVELLRRLGDVDREPVPVDLRESADGKSLEVTRNHLQSMCDEIEQRLRTIIDEEIRNYWNPPGAGDSAAPSEAGPSGPTETRKVQLEQESHRRFGEERAPAKGFVGREEELARIGAYLLDPSDRKPLVVCGPSGTGKTAILARAAQTAVERHKQDSERIVIRFLGTTPQSSSLHALLTSLCRELRPPGDHEKDLPVELRLLQDEFDRLLAAATAEKPILLFLDAIDQLDQADGARQTYWLRTPLPEHVKAVVSCIREDKEPETGGDNQDGSLDKAKLNEPYRAFERRKLLENAIAIESLTDTEAMRVIDTWLAHPRLGEQKRRLAPKQRKLVEDRINSNVVCRRPLYLRILAEEARQWPSWKQVAAGELGAKTAELLDTMFARIEDKSIHGRELVAAAMGYLAAARRGLSQNEMLEVLWADEDYRRHLEEQSRKTNHELPPDATRIPVAIWTRLRHDLAPYLAERDAPGLVVLGIYHREVERVVRERYLAAGARRILRHQRLATYFQFDTMQPWWRPTDGTAKTKDGAPRTRLPNARRASELPWALQLAAEAADPKYERYETWDPPASLLCNIEFVEAKCSAGLVYELQEDYKILKQSLPEAQAELAEERRRDADVARWTWEIVVYSAAWSDRRNRKAHGEEISEPEPVLPLSPQSIHIWNNDAIEKECHRIKSDPNRQDRVSAFAQFLQSELDLLLQFNHYEGFVLQHACNYAPGGPVHDAAHGIVPECNAPMLIRCWPKDADWNPKPALLRTLEEHSKGVTCVNVTPDARRAVSSSYDNTLRVWDLESGRCERILRGQSNHIESVSMTPDGGRAVSGSWDDICVWDLESGRCERTMGGFQSMVKSVSVTPDGRRAVSGGSDNKLRVWDLESGACVLALEGHSGVGISSVSVTPDGRRAVSGDSETLRLWDLENAVCLRTLKTQSSIHGLSVTPDARRAVSAGWETLQVWDLEGGVCLRTLNGHGGQVECVCLTTDGQYAVSGGSEGLGDHALRVWDVESGNCFRTLEGHNFTIKSVSVTPNALRAVSSSEDGTVRLWDLEKGYPRTLIGHSSYAWCVSVTQDGRRAVSGSRDQTLRVWDFESAACLRTLEGHRDSVEVVCVTPDGLYAISGSMDQTLRVWDLESGACLHKLKGHRADVTRVCVTPDSRYAVSASQEDSTLRLWDLKSGICEATLSENDFVFDLTLTADGRRAVSAFERSLKIWDLESGAARSLEGHRDRIWSVRLTPDGRCAVSGSMDKTVRLWDLDSGACLRTLGGHDDGVWTVSVTPDGRRAVSGSKDKTARVWDLETGACLYTLEGHRGDVYGVSVTADGQRVISRSGDALRVWDLKSGRCMAILPPSAPINAVADAATSIAIVTQAGELLLVETHNMPPALGSG